MTSRNHWNQIYGTKTSHEVSWYQPHLQISLELLQGLHLSKDAAIIDIGGGTSTFVDDLLDLGYTNITVLDLSQNAIHSAQSRLGERASLVHWLVADVTQVELEQEHFEFWHDRAVFHFLVEEEARAAYVNRALRALKPDAFIVVATFGPEGPEKCSGLPIVRYDADGIHQEFGEHFQKVGEQYEVHQTPWGSEQEFVYCYCRKHAFQDEKEKGT